MNKKPLWIAMGVLSLALGGFGIYQFGKSQSMASMPAPESDSAAPTVSGAPTGTLPQSVAEGEDATRRHVKSGLKAGDVDPVTGQKILYYHDPMVPGNKFDAPAKSPFMDMMLVPVYAGGDGDAGKVTVSPRVQQNLGVRTAEVVEGTLSPQVSSVGSIAFNERDQVIVQARATGYVERLLVRATLDPVRAGQPLAELYVPDWIAAQEEFLSVQRMQGTELGALVDGARQRMRQVGMSDALIRQVEETGKTLPKFTLTAPIGGVVVELMAREGMTVSSGATLFRINGLGTVWANAEVPESQAALLRAGAKVQAQSPAVPGSTFSGRVQAILPEVNPATRTLKARMELGNPGGRLVPGMFVSMNFMDTRPEKALLVPSEAVIQTGKRTVVMLAEDNGHFRPVEVRAGIESGGQTEIKQGLQAGQRVVSSSQFLIDSEASLRGLEARLNNAPDKKAEAERPRFDGQGKVVAVGRDTLTIAHEAVPALKWKPMTMDFKLPPKGLPRGMTEGDRINFTFTMPKEGPPALIWVTLQTPEPATTASAAATAGSRK
ncbi:efflux RND transporter periplasmic adaptor subunit [Roseateles puraquae]|uniref:Efflux transporter periplasmic adaptor subunit n=1 Tax=Roseateles puraquae TaxID=431059 RepID=A0A254MZT5_9BURK|nr:efflux RND transporter periplasmic adaptor subunit [Roseateles puraquae]MDG0854455.1 efflux RND transporter periplasmic adaptor subunit [Roseateles puraquae]OWR00853.1 efflux transporter periplasmic adaptor subunit [Roseateles puraquae]